MRTLTLAGSLCLLTAASAVGQSLPAGVPAPPVVTTAAGPLPTLAPEVAPPPDPYQAAAERGQWVMTGPRVWGSAEYLLWWITPMNTPPLVQTVPAALAIPGQQLPAGAAATFFPNTRQLEFGPFSGVRATAGVNFTRFGLDVSGFYLEQKNKSASLFTNGFPFAVGQGYVSAGNGVPTTLFASLANQYTGGVTAAVSSRVYGADANVRLPFWAFLTENTDFLTGVRYVNLEEKIALTSSSAFPNGNTITVQDSIRTRNQFYGGQVGFDSRIGGCNRGFGLQGVTKLGLGDMHQQAELIGLNTIQTGGAVSAESGGLYARGANQGAFTRDRFAFLYDLNVNLTYNFNPNTQVYIGYSILYLSSVQRPGEVIDTTINDARARFVANAPPSNANRPAFTWRDNDFWVQGITFGVKLQY